MELSTLWFVNEIGLNYKDFYAIGAYGEMFHTAGRSYFFECWTAPGEEIHIVKT